MTKDQVFGLQMLAYAADAAFQAGLDRAFGKKASGDRRYQVDKSGWPASLVLLRDAKVKADAVWNEAWRAQLDAELAALEAARLVGAAA